MRTAMSLPFRQICVSIFSLLLLSCSAGREDQPATIVCLTFDDAHASVYHQALPILERYGLRASNFVNSALLDGSETMTWDQVVSLSKDYGWETGAHGLSHVNLAELSYPEARQQILSDRQLLVDHGLNPRSFALPYGVCPIDYYDLILPYFDNLRGSNDIPMHSPVDRLNLGYLPFQSGWDAQRVKARISRGVANREALVIIGFHRIATPGEGYADNCPAAGLEEICRWLRDSGLEVMTISEAMAALH
ncbi:MAG: polysaccharide deacetylase family protein [Candidatus Cloacimonetes bacterium]|nr:polysaccharide deacetylase family protein [Candidatus Cloacimonadota bacterium]